MQQYRKEPKFGDYCKIEQKRFGCSNEMYTYKVIGALGSNEWVDVPVRAPATEVIHKGVEPVVRCICEGIEETTVLKFRVQDIELLPKEPVSAPSVKIPNVQIDDKEAAEYVTRMIEKYDFISYEPSPRFRALSYRQGFLDAIVAIRSGELSIPSLPSVQPQSEGGLQWVRASERLPSINGRYFIKAEYIADPSRGIFSHVARFTDGSWDDGYTGVTHTVIEWLDESASPSTANTAVSALQSILRNIDNQHWNCKDFREEIKSIAEQGLKTANTEKGAEAKLPVILLTEEQMFRIAKVIDNNFIGAEKTFTAVRKEGYWLLSTNKCDFASEIKIFGTHESLQRIERLGEDTDGWQPIHEFTMKRVLELYELFLTETKTN